MSCRAADFFHFAEAPDWSIELVLRHRQPEPKSRPSLTMVDASIHVSGKSVTTANNSSGQDNDWRSETSAPGCQRSSAARHLSTGDRRLADILRKDSERDLEEDLSISPKGGRDWGVGIKATRGLVDAGANQAIVNRVAVQRGCQDGRNLWVRKMTASDSCLARLAGETESEGGSIHPSFARRKSAGQTDRSTVWVAQVFASAASRTGCATVNHTGAWFQ